MKQNSNFELLLFAAAEDCIEEEAKEFLSRDTSELEGKLTKQKQAEKLIKKAFRPRAQKRRYRTLLAVAALLIVILVSTACFSLTETGEKAFQAIAEFFDQYIIIDFEEAPRDESFTLDETEPMIEADTTPPPATPPSTIERKIYASYLPGTYTCTVDGTSEFYYTLSYYDLDNNWVFSIMQSTISKDTHYSDYENHVTENIIIHGKSAFLIKDDSQPDFYTLIWRDSSYEYSICGFFKDVNTLKQIAEGIALE